MSSGEFRTSLVAQTGKSLPATQETWARSLGWEDPLQKEMATHSSILAREIHPEHCVWREGLGPRRPWGSLLPRPLLAAPAPPADCSSADLGTQASHPSILPPSSVPLCTSCFPCLNALLPLQTWKNPIPHPRASSSVFILSFQVAQHVLVSVCMTLSQGWGCCLVCLCTSRAGIQ